MPSEVQLRAEASYFALTSVDPAQLLMAFPSLPPPTRLRLLEDLLPLLSTPELLMLNSNIGPRLKRDFLKELPDELGLHVLSFVSWTWTVGKFCLVLIADPSLPSIQSVDR